jgi:hypothetical protein
MALVEQDFLVEQGSTFILQFDLKKDDDTALTTTQTNQYTTIATTTDISLGMKVRKTKYGTNTPILGITYNAVLQSNVESTQGNTVDGFYFDSENQGRVKFVISSTTTASLKYGKYFYDIEVIQTKGSGTEVTKALSGRVEIEAEATN